MAKISRRIMIVYFLPEGRESNFTFGSLLNIFDEDDSFEVIKFNFAEDDLSNLENLLHQVEVVFLHYSLLYQRVRPRVLEFFQPLEALNVCKAFKIAMPQDEGAFPGVLDDLLVYWDVDLLISVHFSEKGMLYPNARHTLEIFNVLPAFVKKEWLESVPPIPSLADRSMGLAYRGRQSMWRHGRANYAKSDFAMHLASMFEDIGWETDVSNSDIDRIYGDDWRTFIENARLVYGSPGGYTAIDYYGELNRRVNRVLRDHTPPDFEEFSNVMPQGWDSSNLLTITSRHFEAAYYGTAQILYESEYKGLIQPNKHYVPVSDGRDSLEDIAHLLNDDDYLISTIEAFRKDTFKHEFTFEALKTTTKELINTSIGTGTSKAQVREKNISLAVHAHARLQTLGYLPVSPAHRSKPNFMGLIRGVRHIGRVGRRGGYKARNKSLVYSKRFARRGMFRIRRGFFSGRRLARRTSYFILMIIRRSYYLPRRMLIDSVKFILRRDTND